MARPSTRHDARSSLTATQVVESSASSLYQSRHRPSGQCATHASITRSELNGISPTGVQRSRSSLAYSTIRRAWPSQRSGMPSMTVRYMR